MSDASKRFLTNFEQALRQLDVIEGATDRLVFVDYSEVHGFATGGVLGPPPSDLNPDWFLVLATHHLFVTSSLKPVYLLPAHEAELRLKVEVPAEEAELIDRTATQILENVPEDIRRELEKKDPDLASIETWLLGYAKEGDLGELFATLLRRLNRKQDLLVVIRRLVSNSRLTLTLPEENRPTRLGSFDDQVLAIFNKFPNAVRRRNRPAKLIDSRALFYFKALLTGSKRPCFLVTRDTSLRNVALDLGEDDRSWRSVADRILPLEVLLLDLFIIGLEPPKRRQWMDATTKVLSRILEQVAEVSALNSRGTEGLVSRAASDFLRYLNLQLPDCYPRVYWLKSALQSQAPPRDSRALGPIARVLASSAFGKQAHLNALAQMAQMDAESARLSFLLSIRGAPEGRAFESDVFSIEEEAHADKTVLRARPTRGICAVEFTNPALRERLRKRALGQPGSLRTHFDTVVDIAMEEESPEAFLFMAFVLAIIQQWPPAVGTLSHLIEVLPSDGTDEGSWRREAHYLCSVVLKQRGKSSSEPAGDLWLALKAIEEAIALRARDPADARSEDPRYLTEKATIVLMLRRLGAEAGRSLPSADECIAWLERAMEMAGQDVDLKVQIANNLAYAYVVDVGHLRDADGPGASTDADERVRKALELCRTVEKDTQGARWVRHDPELQDTIWWVHALEASRARRFDHLRKSLDALVAIEGGGRDVSQHRSQVEKWVSEFPIGD